MQQAAELDTAIFSGHGNLLMFFGQGLAEASDDKIALWHFLIDAYARAPKTQWNIGVLVGAIKVIRDADPAEADRILEDCIERAELRPVLLRLQEEVSLEPHGIDRLRRLIDCEDVPVWQLSGLGWGEPWDDVPEQHVAELLEQISRRDDGARVAIDALDMRFSRQRKNDQVASPQIRKLALVISESALRHPVETHDPHLDHHLERVLKISFLPDENPVECAAIIEALVDNVICASRRFSELDHSASLIAKRMPHALLSKLKYDADPAGYRMYLTFRSRHDKALLADVAPEDLSSWCKEDDSPDRFIFTINAIEVFTGDGHLTQQALHLLEHAPDQARALLEIFRRARPTMWSGNKSDILKARKDGLGVLHVAAFFTEQASLAEHIQELETEIAAVLEQERSRDEDREQRFE